MLATLTQLKDWLGVDATETDEDAARTAALEVASAMIARYCQRTIEYADADITEYIDGGTRDLCVVAWPIVSVASVAYSADYDWDSETPEVENTDFRVIATRGVITRLPIDTKWIEGRQVWRVVYKGGYWPADGGGGKPADVSDLPDHISKACLVQAAEVFKRRQEPGYKVVEGLVGGTSTGFAPDLELVKAAKQLLAGERRVT